MPPLSPTASSPASPPPSPSASHGPNGHVVRRPAFLELPTPPASPPSTVTREATNGTAPQDTPPDGDEPDSPERPKTRNLIRTLWKRSNKSDDHDKMPCWKQYFVLFIGTLVVAGCTIAVTVLFTVIPPIQQYFVMFSFAGSVPLSLVLHLIARTVMRYLRKYLALRRGRQVEGAYSRKGKQQASRRVQEDRRSVNVAVDGVEQADTDANIEASQSTSRTFRKAVSAHIAGAHLDAAMSLNERISIDLESESQKPKGKGKRKLSVQWGATGDAGKRTTGVMTRPSASLADPKPKTYDNSDDSNPAVTRRSLTSAHY